MKFGIGDRVYYHPVIGEEPNTDPHYVYVEQFNDPRIGPVYWITNKSGYVHEAALSLAEPSWCTNRYMHVIMPDSSVWAIKVGYIALNRAKYYAVKEYDGDIAKSMDEDTIPFAMEWEDGLMDWAANNMNWDDVRSFCHEIETNKPEVDYQDGWVNGEKKIVKIF